MKTTYVVLLSIDLFTKKDAKKVQGKNFAGFREFWEFLRKEISELTDNERFIYTLEGFSAAWNNDEIIMDYWYMTFFHIIN